MCYHMEAWLYLFFYFVEVCDHVRAWLYLLFVFSVLSSRCVVAHSDPAIGMSSILRRGYIYYFIFV